MRGARVEKTWLVGKRRWSRARRCGTNMRDGTHHMLEEDRSTLEFSAQRWNRSQKYRCMFTRWCVWNCSLAKGHVSRTKLHCTALYRTVQHCTALYDTVWYCTSVFSTVQQCTALCSTAYATVTPERVIACLSGDSREPTQQQ